MFLFKLLQSLAKVMNAVGNWLAFQKPWHPRLLTRPSLNATPSADSCMQTLPDFICGVYITLKTLKLHLLVVLWAQNGSTPLQVGFVIVCSPRRTVTAIFLLTGTVDSWALFMHHFLSWTHITIPGAPSQPPEAHSSFLQCGLHLKSMGGASV